MCMITYTQLMGSFASVSCVFWCLLDNDENFDRMLASMKPSQSSIVLESKASEGEAVA